MAETLQEQVQTLIKLIGLNETAVDIDLEGRRVSVFVNEGEWFKRWAPRVINDLEHLIRLLARKANHSGFFIDVNNYRKERERIIIELAKAAARKVTTMKSEVRLPAMNAYERRLIHLELSLHPEVTTESVGEGVNRCVIVRPLLV